MPRPTPPTLPPLAAAIRQQAARYATATPAESVAVQRDLAQDLLDQSITVALSGASLGSLAAPPSITINVAALQYAATNRAGHLAGAMQEAAAPPPVPVQYRMREPEAGFVLRKLDNSRRLPARELQAEGGRWRLEPGDGCVIATLEPRTTKGSTANVVTMHDHRLLVPHAVCIRAGLPVFGEVAMWRLGEGRWAFVAASDLLPVLRRIVGQQPAQASPGAAATARVIPINRKENTA